MSDFDERVARLSPEKQAMLRDALLRPPSVARAARKVAEQLAHQLPAFMQPSEILVVPELLRSPNGKINRAALLATDAQAPDVSPDSDQIEAKLLAVFRRVLGPQIGPEDDFLARGGTSLSALRIAHAVHANLGQQLKVEALLRARSVRNVAAIMRGEPSPSQWSVSLDREGPARVPTDPILFLVAPLASDASVFRDLTAHLELRAIGLHVPPGESLPTLDAIAARLASEIVTHVENSRCLLAGWSSGGQVAAQIGVHLARPATTRVALLDTVLPESPKDLLEAPEAIEAQTFLRADGAGWFPPSELQRDMVRRANRRLWGLRLVAEHVPQPVDFPVTLFEASEQRVGELDKAASRLRWAAIATRGVTTVRVPGNHSSIVKGAHAAVLARALNTWARGA